MANVKQSARYQAMETLESIEKNQAFSHLMIQKGIQASNFSPQDASLYTELVYGTTQRKITLDYYLDPYIKKGKRLDLWVRILLRLSLYQAIYLDRIPDHAIINEAVEIAKHKGHPGTGKLVNAILRNVQRHPLPDLDQIEDPIRRYSIKYSLPEELSLMLAQQLDEEEMQALGESLLDRPKTSVRVNTKYISVEEAQDILNENGYNVQKSEVSPDGLIIDKGYIADTELFQKGFITIQDESSMLVTEALELEKDSLVLDACAAPGGKTTHMANYIETGQIYASDLKANKLSLIEDNVKRQGFSELVTTNVQDAKKLSDVHGPESFDRVLIDAPCSGLGLMRRKPDIKYSKSQEDIYRLQQVQIDILESAASLVKRGGLLVYSTCTILEQENQEVINHFLVDHPDYIQEKIELETTKLGPDDKGAIRILPQDAGTDGFFIAKLRKL